MNEDPNTPQNGHWNGDLWKLNPRRLAGCVFPDSFPYFELACPYCGRVYMVPCSYPTSGFKATWACDFQWRKLRSEGWDKTPCGAILTVTVSPGAKSIHYDWSKPS
jgi:hypothetical protein